MDIRPKSTVFQIFAHDVARSLSFYRLLGLPVPESSDTHVAVDLPGGNTLSFDTEDTIAGMHPGWTPPSSPIGRLALNVRAWYWTSVSVWLADTSGRRLLHSSETAASTAV